MARVISFGDDGEIDIPETKLTKVVVRYPTAKEQAKGMTIVPRSTRLKEFRGNKKRS